MSKVPEAGGKPLRGEGDDPAAPRPAATVILLRRGGKDADRELEVLLVQRNPAARFMPGVWVFPGGAVDPDEAEGEAAARELHEEAGIAVDPDSLVPYSRWITPRVVPVRFDTLFFLAVAPTDAPPRPDGSETVAAGWYSPRRALDLHDKGEMGLVFPTIKHLESLLPYANAADALAAARRREVRPVEPEVVGEGSERRIVVPDELP